MGIINGAGMAVCAAGVVGTGLGIFKDTAHQAGSALDGATGMPLATGAVFAVSAAGFTAFYALDLIS